VVRNVLNRRRFIRGVGAVSITAGLAGCSGGDGDGGGDGGGDTDTTESGDGETDTTEGGDGETDTTESGDGGSDGGDVPAAVEEYLSDANQYDGSVTDMTGSDSVTVDVGAGSDGFAFAPAAVRVSTGTEVTWEWTGEGGSHNVVAQDGGDFESELVGEEGHTFSQTFEETGVVTYYCNPHRGVGMKGAIVVE
jgi:halocyanin-like protein